MKTKSVVLFLSILLFGLYSCTHEKTSAVYNVVDFGAVGDSLTMNKKAIQAAIDAAYDNGGGKVIVPAPGKFIIGTIWIKDNVTLEVQAGATLLGSDNIADYDSVSWGHNEDRCPYHLIMAKDADNVTIQGRGTIDGRGYNFYDYTPVKPRWMMKHTPRPSPMVEFDNCTNVKVKDIFLTNSAGWTLHTFNCDQVHINGIRLINNLFGPNNDGIDVTGCTNVMISDCYVKTCDDAVCLKTTSDSKELRNVTVTNCTMHTTCVALKFGETSKNMGDVTFSNCVITQSSRAFGIYATWGGDVENVVVSNIVANTNAPLVLNRPFQISAWNFKGRDGETKWKGGNVRNVIVSNFIGTTEGRILLNANDGLSIENITLKDIKLTYPYIEDPEKYAPEATSGQFRGIDKEGMAARAALVASNVNNLTLDGFDIMWPKNDSVPMDWRHPERIENGKMDKVHKPDYDAHVNPNFNAAFFNNVQGGYVFSPMVKASKPKLETFKIQNSSIKVLGEK